MSDFVLMEGDLATFEPAFGPAVVVVRPGTLSGSGPSTLAGKPLCLEGDEAKVSVPGCPYTAGPYCIPGVGALRIQSLAPNQKAIKTRAARRPVLLKGGCFIATFQVLAPAQQPNAAGAVPDPTPLYTGSGAFVTTNIKFTVS
jgi:hypothetical protein